MCIRDSEYTNKEHTEVGVHIEYLATPDLTDKVLIIADPMLATGISMEMGMKAVSYTHLYLAVRPRISNINYVGLKKSEREDMEQKLSLIHI